MTLRLVCRPGRTVTWKKFQEYPARSIAVDGFCSGRPQATKDGLRININHHEEVDRFATRSSCDQALILVKMGLYERLQEDGRPSATLYVNDCDQDVAFATYVLMHPKHADRPKLKQLIRLEDLLDMSAGLYPVRKKWHLIRQLNWITEEYTDLRSRGLLGTLNAGEMEALLLRMHRRIRDALFGRVKEVFVDTRFERLEEHEGWTLVRETGKQARLGMAEAGVKAFITVLEEGEGRWRYALGRLSHFIPFPLGEFYEALNAAEGIGRREADRWGGSENSGGSPRKSGSSLTPEMVGAVIDGCLDKVR